MNSAFKPTHHFTRLSDVSHPKSLFDLALQLKADPVQHFAEAKTLAMLFFNPSLRTRLSTQKAAFNLGMHTMVLDVLKDSWALEFEDGVVMNLDKAEHVKEAAAVISEYCDAIALRTFPTLKSRSEDYSESILNAFIENATVPIVSMESATRHPMQSVADLVTIKEQQLTRPKIVVSWAPHPRVLPHAVVNSFLEWSTILDDAEIVLAQPQGYELDEEFTNQVTVTNDQEKALKDADIVYVKNWSSYNDYGKTPHVAKNWMIDEAKMKLTNHGKFMHCLPLRRNVVASDHVVDHSIVVQQAANREFATQAILKSVIERTL